MLATQAAVATALGAGKFADPRACSYRAAVSASGWLVKIGAASAAVTLGCGTPYEPNDTSASSSSTADTTTTDAMTSSTGVTSSDSGIQTVTTATTPATATTTGTTEADVCPSYVEALAATIAAGQPCEVLVELDDAGAALGFDVVCGTTGSMWSAGKEIGDATECCSEGATVYPAEEDAPLYVLHRADAQGPDGVALLSNHTGRVMLDVIVGEGGPASFVVPATWSDAAGLAAAMGCGDPNFSLGSAQSFDLEQGGAALGQAELDAVGAAVADTALGPALAAVSTQVRAAVLRFAPEAGGPAHDFVLIEVQGS